MFLSDASTKRPVAMSCLLIALIGLGLNSYRKLSLENLPATDIPYVSITTTWVGATPEDMETNVARRIEDAVSQLDGLKHIQSICLENVCRNVLEFNLDVDVDIAAVDVREKLDAVLQELPDDCDRPVIQKININATSVVKLALFGDATIEDKYDYVDNTLSDKFSSIPGVGSVDIIGGSEREVHIELDRDAMTAAGLTSRDVMQVVSANMNNLPSGRIRENGTEISVKFDADYPLVEQMAGFEVVSRNGVRRQLGDLGKVFMTTDEVRQRAWCDGEECLLLSIVKKGEANTVALVEACQKKVEELNPLLPGGMRLELVSEEGGTIRTVVSSTESDIVSGILLCAFLLFLFLGDLRTTVIVCVSMPLTIVISFFFMQLAGQTLNITTLLALGLSIGILVSNSIVILENVSLWMDRTSNSWEAAAKGTSEMAVSVLASAGTNVVVMFPLTMMWSMVGRIMKPFATTTLIVNLVSIFISFTLTPILCALLLKPKSRRRRTWFTRASDWWTQRIFRLGGQFGRAIGWCANRRAVCLGVAAGSAALFVFFVKLGGRIGFTMMEQADKGKIMIVLEYPVNYALSRTHSHVIALADEFRGTMPDMEHCIVQVGKTDSIGSSVSEAVYVAQILMNFKQKTERSWTIQEAMDALGERMAKETGVFYTIAAPSEMGGIATPINFKIKGSDLDTLDSIGRGIRKIGQQVPGISSIDTSVREGKPQMLITPKRTVMQDAGLTSSGLGVMLRANLDGIKAATFKSGDRSYDIRVKFAEEPGRQQVRQFMIPGKNGTPVLISSVADITERVFPVTINRYDKERVAIVTGTLEGTTALAVALDELTGRMQKQNVLPEGYSISLSGDAEYLGDAVKDFGEAILIAAFLTYLTIAAIMESFTLPFLILLTLPFGLMGVIGGLLVTGWNVNILVMLGALMLIGVVVNAAILIVDRCSSLKKQGLSSREAMVRASAESFRAVLMVILASTFGMLPIALAKNVGSEMRAGIGAASAGGIAVAGFMTIIAIPLIYCLFTRKPKQSGDLKS